MYLNTIPFWHNFTGPSKRKDFSLNPRTAFDACSKVHDLAFRNYNASRVFFGAFKSKDQSERNIIVDRMFFESFYIKIVTLDYFKEQYEYCKHKNMFLTLLDYLFETILEFTVLIEAAILILGTNILLNKINIWRHTWKTK